MKVAAVQHDIVWEDALATRERVAPLIRAAAGMGARLVVLPEMFPTGFSMNTEKIAEEWGGPSLEFLATQAAKHDIWLCGSFAERSNGSSKPANTAVVVGPDGETFRYRKIHPFTFDGEDQAFEAGDEFTRVNIEGVRFTIFICYDLRFADEFWAMAQETDCYVVPANWPSTRVAHWKALLTARAIENQAYVVGVNRVGAGGDPKRLQYTGCSRIVNPLGEVVASAADGEAIILADVDADEVSRVRDQFPFLNDRRATAADDHPAAAPRV